MPESSQRCLLVSDFTMQMDMNARLAETVENTGNICVMNTEAWIRQAGRNAFSPKLWYMGKVPFGDPVFMGAARDLKAAMRAAAGGARKMIVLDLDDTLWGGIVGEVGWENLKLGGHDPVGEAFVDFQQALKALTRRGIILGIVSKNEERVALEAIRSHPEMVLRLDDFAGWKINWQDKLRNLIELAGQVNLGLQSIVFIDDNPAERDRVRSSLPEVLVPEWPRDKMMYKTALLELNCFQAPALSREDADRTRMYVIERQRDDLRQASASIEDWLQSLEMELFVEELNDANIGRVSQLLNKTNQMNLATRRMTEAELRRWAAADGHKVWSLRVKDKLGDNGITGIFSLAVEAEIGRICDFLLSCRVMGRRIEETMLYCLVRFAQGLELETLVAHYQKTEKNAPCLAFLQNSGMTPDTAGKAFTWPLKQAYPQPDCVQLHWSS